MSYHLGSEEVATGTMTEREVPVDHETVIFSPTEIVIPKATSPGPLFVGAGLALAALMLFG